MIDRRQVHIKRVADLVYYRLLILCGVCHVVIHKDDGA